MKKRIRRTGEIVEIITYCAPLNEIRADGDWVSYIDSKGSEHHCESGLNIYWDFEDVEDVLTKEIDWEEVRINAAIAVLKGFYSNLHNMMVDTPIQKISEWSVSAANFLITELKKNPK